MRPIDGASDEAMFHWVVMDVIGMRAKVVLVGDVVLPKAALPDTALSAFDAARGDDILARDAARERRFQLCPSSSVIGIARR